MSNWLTADIKPIIRNAASYAGLVTGSRLSLDLSVPAASRPVAPRHAILPAGTDTRSLDGSFHDEDCLPRWRLAASSLVALVLVLAGCALTTPASPDPTVQPTSAAAASGPPATPAPAPRSATADEIERLQAAIDADPSDAGAQRDLGFALLQRVRETADPSLYAPAEAAFERARSLAPDDALVLVGIGSLQLGKHEFAAALETARRAIDMAPRSAVARAIEVDALVELGRYDEADEAAAAMLALGSDLTTLSRVSYLAELHGKLDVAVTAMRAATKSEGVAPENLAFTHVQLGNLLVYSGDPRRRGGGV